MSWRRKDFIVSVHELLHVSLKIIPVISTKTHYYESGRWMMVLNTFNYLRLVGSVCARNYESHSLALLHLLHHVVCPLTWLDGCHWAQVGRALKGLPVSNFLLKFCFRVSCYLFNKSQEAEWNILSESSLPFTSQRWSHSIKTIHTRDLREVHGYA